MPLQYVVLRDLWGRIFQALTSWSIYLQVILFLVSATSPKKMKILENLVEGSGGHVARSIQGQEWAHEVQVLLTRFFVLEVKERLNYFVSCRNIGLDLEIYIQLVRVQGIVASVMQNRFPFPFSKQKHHHFPYCVYGASSRIQGLEYSQAHLHYCWSLRTGVSEPRSLLSREQTAGSGGYGPELHRALSSRGLWTLFAQAGGQPLYIISLWEGRGGG